MEYNLVGIDTIKFTVPKEGFNTWLRRNHLKKVKLEQTALTSSQLIKESGKKNTFLRLVRYNKHYDTKLCNYLIVRKSAENYKHYIVEIAGLHQPTNTKLDKSVFQMINKLLKKYMIESIDLAYDFLIKSECLNEHNGVSIELLKELFPGFIYNNPMYKGTYYLKLGAQDPEHYQTLWRRDSKLYNKYAKESRRRPDIDKRWYRLELCVDSDKFLFPEVDVYKRNAANCKRIMCNRLILENMFEYFTYTPIFHSALDTLSSSPFDYSLYM